MSTTLFPLCNGGPIDDDGPSFPSPRETTTGGELTRLLEARREPKKFMKAAEGQRNPRHSRPGKVTKPKVKNLAKEAKLKVPKGVPVPNRGVRVSESAGRLPDGSGFFTATVNTRKKESGLRRMANHLENRLRHREARVRSRMRRQAIESSEDEVAPPGREEQVKKLKRKGNIDNPFAVSWASYNKSHDD
jgi:hypothetical protein